MNDKKISLLIFLFSFGFFLLLSFNWVDHQRPTGDEPHYLIITQSLVKDHDLDLKNNYDNRDYQKWGYPQETLDRHISVKSAEGREYSIHSIGWPTLMLPSYYLGGRLGVIIFNNLLAAILMVNIFLFLKSFVKTKIALFISSAIMFSAPMVIFSATSFNEISAALFIFYTFRKTWGKPAYIWINILAILAFSFLPWIHAKYFLISFVLFIFWVARNFNRHKIFLGLIYPLSLGFLISYDHHFYNSFSIFAQYPSQMNLPIKQLYLGISSLFLDKAFGILPYTPIYLFTFAGLYFLYLKEKRLTIELLILFLSLFMIQALGAIYIGWAPIGRFLVPILPLLSLPLAIVYLNLQKWSKILFWHLAFWGFLCGFLFIRHPDLNFSLSKPKLLDAMSSSLFNIPKFFPKLLDVETYATITSKNIILLIIWIAIILLFTLVIVITSYRNAKRS